MENIKNNTSQIQQTIVDNFQRLAQMSLETMKPLMENMFENISSANKTILDGKIPNFNLGFQSKENSKCSIPDEKCPPHCIDYISREAMAGERIVVPFLIKNDCNTVKTYRVGVRELKDDDGKLAPSQPILNKASVTIESGRNERVLMSIDLESFLNTTYTTEIVLRENDINQNICFNLYVNTSHQKTITPNDEKKLKLKWLNWQSHFYCEPVNKSDGGYIDTDYGEDEDSGNDGTGDENDGGPLPVKKSTAKRKSAAKRKSPAKRKSTTKTKSK